MLDFGCWMLGRGHFRRLSLRADAWAGRWVMCWRRYVVGFTTGQVGDLPHILHFGCLANRSQIGFPLFAEALELVEGAVEAALQTAFLAVEQAQRLFAPTCGAGHLAGVIKFKIL